MVKHLRGQILGLSAISQPAYYVGIYALEVIFVERREPRRIFLCRLNEKPLVRFFPQSLQRVLRAE
jgi:hypothetical protein